MNHKVENCLSAGLQFLILEIKTLPAWAGDLFYSSWSPVGWSGKGCHVKWQNDSRTECICNHLTHFAVLMQFDTDSELKTGQNSRLQKVGHRTERTKVSLSLGSGKEGPERASQTVFIAISNIIFFQTRIRGQISAYLTSRVAVTFRVPLTYSRIPHCILFATDPVSRECPSRHWGKAGHSIRVYTNYFPTTRFPSNTETYQRLPESRTVFC